MSSTIESVLQEDRLFPPSAAFVQQANVSGMASYQALCDEAGDVWPANYNCPGQLVISGSVNGVQVACERLKAAGAKRALPLQVGGANLRLGERGGARIDRKVFLSAAGCGSAAEAAVVLAGSLKSTPFEEPLRRHAAHPVRAAPSLASRLPRPRPRCGAAVPGSRLGLGRR